MILCYTNIRDKFKLGEFIIHVHMQQDCSMNFVLHLPTAGDMEREPDEPVGEGVGRITCCEFGVPGGPEPMPL